MKSPVCAERVAKPSDSWGMPLAFAHLLKRNRGEVAWLPPVWSEGEALRGASTALHLTEPDGVLWTPLGRFARRFFRYWRMVLAVMRRA